MVLLIFIDKFSQAKLSTTDDVTWKEREAAVLALGAIAEGCFAGLYPHLSEVMVIYLFFFSPNIWFPSLLFLN